MLLAASVLIVFLVLAALYESWSIPLAVLLIAPLGVFGAVLAVLARGWRTMSFFNVGLITIIGLSAKNAILLVASARHWREQEAGLVTSGAEGPPLEAVRFAYDGDGQPAINDINLVIPAGSHVAIVGPTGSGKTTLGYLLARLYDVDSGAIRFDGVDLRNLGFDTLSQMQRMKS